MTKKLPYTIKKDSFGHWTARIDTLDGCTSIIHRPTRIEADDEALRIYTRAVDRKTERGNKKFNESSIKKDISFVFGKGKKSCPNTM
jgi:ribosomal protein S6